MWAAGHGNDVPQREGIEMAKLLLAEGAKLDEIDNRGRTALSIAASRGHEGLIRLLLEQGASNILDKEGLSAADLAVKPSIRELLKDHSNPQD